MSIWPKKTHNTVYNPQHQSQPLLWCDVSYLVKLIFPAPISPKSLQFPPSSSSFFPFHFIFLSLSPAFVYSPHILNAHLLLVVGWNCEWMVLRHRPNDRGRTDHRRKTIVACVLKLRECVLKVFNKREMNFPSYEEFRWSDWERGNLPTRSKFFVSADTVLFSWARNERRGGVNIVVVWRHTKSRSIDIKIKY